MQGQQTGCAGDARKWLVWLEPKYTWSPRWFTAMRIERGLAASVEPEPAGPWEVETGKILDLEVGAGFRIDPRWLAKASYRAALSGAAAGVEPGSAVAVQLSYDFDVSAWLDRPR